MAAVSLPRATRPLTEGHKAVIRIIAERAVADYLREIEAADESDQGYASHRKETTA